MYSGRSPNGWQWQGGRYCAPVLLCTCLSVSLMQSAVSQCKAGTQVYQTQSMISTHQPSVYHGTPDLNWWEGQRGNEGELSWLCHSELPSNHLEKYPLLIKSWMLTVLGQFHVWYLYWWYLMRQKMFLPWKGISNSPIWVLHLARWVLSHLQQFD